ncbi:MAG TPA: hypothetical protein VLA09_03785 [Longimicrobiales bacterium]|nr:hypothetical protein [Longimicrobiales bacterium]
MPRFLRFTAETPRHPLTNENSHPRRGTKVLRLALPAVIVFSLLPGPVQGQRTIDRAQLTRYFRPLSASTAVRLVSPSADSAVANAVDRIRLDPGTYLTMESSAAAQRTVDAGVIKFALPDRYLGVDESGSSEVLLRSVMLVSQVLRWGGDGVGFQGRVLVGVEDSLSSGPRSLSPIGGRVISPRADSVSPASFTIARTNTSGFREIALTSLDPGDSLPVTLVTDLQRDGAQMRLPVDRPILSLQVSPSRIRGLGLEEAEIRIQMQGAAGPATVSLSTEDGHLEPGALSVSPGAVATSSLRSRGWGSTTVRANRPSFVEGTATIEYYFPTLFLVLALVGGLVGGLLRAFQARGGERAVGFGSAAAAGMLAGAVLSFAFGVGIHFDWLPVPAGAAEAGAALAAAIGGYAGPSVMEMLTGRKGGG